MDQAALLSYAREAADFSTNHQLPTLDFAINHYGQPDVAMFDFTCMYASENAALVRQRNGHKLLVALVGDSLLEVSETAEVFKASHETAFYCSTSCSLKPLLHSYCIPSHCLYPWFFCGHIWLLNVVFAVVSSPSGPWALASPEVSWQPWTQAGW